MPAVDFVAIATTGQWLTIESDVIRTGSTICFAQSLVKADGANIDYVIVFQPSAFKGIASLIGKAPVGVLRDQLLVRSIDS